ncbi:MAG TPA: M48 family metalloprotease [Steroidobacteraceae bacterium]|nr:M48 family metalloprotease [Steroidobacteraceae bacterium]
MLGRKRITFSIVAGLLAVGGCATNPVTGESQLALISESQEIELGRSAAEEVGQSMGLVDDPALQAYVSAIGQRLAANSERPELPWQFAVVDDPTPNAFALPGGYIFLTRGLLNLMGSEAELATVIGHEIGHVTARHSVAQLSRAQLAQLGLGLGMVLAPELRSLGDLAGSGLSLLFLKYGRDAERQADELGFRYALEQNYDVTEMADVFEALQRSGELAGASPVPGWLATHPAEEERIAAVRQRIASLGIQQQDPRTGRVEYLEQIDGLVFGSDPRQGFFRDGTFYHPELRFKFSTPQGWQTRNMTSAVIAISPQQDGAVQLTLSGSPTPAQAAQAFGAQQGVSVARGTQRSFNGIPATILPFQAQSQQGAVRGYAAFLAHGGRVYQMLTYAPGNAFAAHDSAFGATIASFAPVSDPDILAVEPARIDIVRLDRTTTLQQLAARRPTRTELEKLALINQVADANVPLPAGTYVKWVEGGP